MVPWRPWWAVCACAALAVAAVAGAAEPRLLGSAASYSLESAVLLNDVDRKDKEVGYKIMAELDVTPVWADPHDQYLLKFRLRSPKLYLKGKHIYADFIPHDSIWDQNADSTFYAHWKKGVIETVYLDPTELADVLNYKKSVVSLFQFQSLAGEHNETDISGSCLVLYETISTTVLRKIKKRCEHDSHDAVSSARRLVRYTLDDELTALASAFADELLVLGDPRLGLKARAWHRLQAAGGPGVVGHAASLAASLDAALAALPGRLRALPLAVDEAQLADAPDPFDDDPETGALAAAALVADAERAGGGGSGREARALLLALGALRRAPAAELAALPTADLPHDHLSALCRLAGAAGTRAAHAAVRDALRLHDDPPPALAHAYLAAFALAAAPDEWALLDVLRLGERAPAGSPALAEAALLAAAAAARRASPALAQRVRDALALGLARCQDEACRTVRVRALGNLRRADTADLLLERAARAAAEPRAALAALLALAAVPPRALTFARLDRLEDVALDERAPLEVRAAALDLAAVRRARLPAPLARLVYRLRERGPPELLRLLWRRLEALAARHEAVARLPAALEPAARGWDARALAGASAVLVREAARPAGGRRALLEAVQVMSAGLLRRGTVRLLAEDEDAADDDRADELLSVEMWTRGLEAFGAGADAAAEEPNSSEDAGAGLEIVVGGARMREITLFEGQAELLGHVWAGTGSAPTPVLRALRETSARRAVLPLVAGARLAAAWRGAQALALDAQAQASLWWRSARAQLRLRAALLAEAGARVLAAWGDVRARAASLAEPRLRVAADLDFYGEVRLCVRARVADRVDERNVTLGSRLGARELRVRRARRTRLPSAGRTLALGRPNDDTCRTLREADAADEADEADEP